MASCYLCGCSVRNGEGYRRKVLTSQSARVYFTKRGGGSYGHTYALRTLCASCASNLDRQNKKLSWQLPVSLVVAVIGIIMAFRWSASSHSTPSSLGSLGYAFFLFGGPGFIAYFALRAFFSGEREDSLSYQDHYYDDETSVPSPTRKDNIIGSLNEVASPSVSKSNDDDFSFYIDGIREVATEFNDIGISFFGCYGFEISQENFSSLVDKVLENMPPNHYSSKSDWKKAVSKNSYNIFISKAGKTVAHDDPDSFDLDGLLLIFPGNEMETTENYIMRIQNATRVAFERSSQ